MGKGAALYQLQRYDEAVTAFQKVTRLDPSEDEAYFWIGNSYVKLGRYPEAISAYERTLAINPGYRQAFQNLSQARAGMEQATAPAPSPSPVKGEAAIPATSASIATTPSTTPATPAPTRTPLVPEGVAGVISITGVFLAVLRFARR
jgi:tetratricopeptide (TPR) repeat protein